MARIPAVTRQRVKEELRAVLAFNANAVDLGLPQQLTEPPLPV